MSTSTLAWLFGSQMPFAIALGSGSVAHSNGGGAVAVANGDGARAQAVSNGGYAETVAVGKGAVSKAEAGVGEVNCDKQVVEEDGTVKHDNFFHPHL